jgi:hypothetical protein
MGTTNEFFENDDVVIAKIMITDSEYRNEQGVIREIIECENQGYDIVILGFKYGFGVARAQGGEFMVLEKYINTQEYVDAISNLLRTCAPIFSIHYYANGIVMRDKNAKGGRAHTTISITNGNIIEICHPFLNVKTYMHIDKFTFQSYEEAYHSMVAQVINLATAAMTMRRLSARDGGKPSPFLFLPHHTYHLQVYRNICER